MKVEESLEDLSSCLLALLNDEKYTFVTTELQASGIQRMRQRGSNVNIKEDSDRSPRSRKVIHVLSRSCPPLLQTDGTV